MRRPLASLPLSLLLLVLLATPAFAHATFDVTQLPAGTSQDLTLRVPLERDAVNELVEVLVPGVFEVSGCDGTDGWDCEQAATQDGDTVVTLTRQPDGAGDTERFTLTMTAPAEEGVYTFPTIQTYDDGEEVAWVNDPGTDRPAPRIQVGDGTTEVEYAGDASPHTELATKEPAAEEPTDDASTGAATDDAATGDDTTDETDESATTDDESPEAATDDATDETDDDASLDAESASGDGETPWLAILLGLLVAGGAVAIALRKRA